MLLHIIVSISVGYPMVSAELVPGTSLEYTTLPGYGYAGDSQVGEEIFLTYLDQLFQTIVSLGPGGDIGEQMCSSRCSLAYQCQAFFMEGEVR